MVRYLFTSLVQLPGETEDAGLLLAGLSLGGISLRCISLSHGPLLGHHLVKALLLLLQLQDLGPLRLQLDVCVFQLGLDLLLAWKILNYIHPLRIPFSGYYYIPMTSNSINSNS